MRGGSPTLPHVVTEFKRRKVWQVAAIYVAAAGGVWQAADLMVPHLQLPDWSVTLVIVLTILGFPIALALAWSYDITRGGIERTKSPGTAPSTGVAEGQAAALLSRIDVSAETAEHSIVVLPFENMSPDPGDAYLADGLSEEITADLAGIRALRVISRTSAFHFRGATKGVRSIARELSVRYVLEGSVRKAGEELRITAQLIDATTDAHLWAQKYSGTMADIFDLQERVSRSVVGALAVRLDAGEAKALGRHAVPDVRALELYLRGRQEVYRFTGDGLEAGRRYLEQALGIVGENAAILGQLAHVHYQFWNMGVRLDEEDLRLAREYGDRALALDPDSADHLFIRALLEVTGGDAVRALTLFEAALGRDADHADALGWYPMLAGFLGLRREAMDALGRLGRVDPLNPFNWCMPPWIEINAGHLNRALELADRERRLRPGDLFVETAYAIASAAAGHREEAAQVIRGVWKADGGVLAKLYLTLAHAFEGDEAGVTRLVDADVERWARKDFEYSLWLAQALALVGRTERALDWLDNSVERGNINYPYIAVHDPLIESLRGSERFDRIAERARAGWESRHALSRVTGTHFDLPVFGGAP